MAIRRTSKPDKFAENYLEKVRNSAIFQLKKIGESCIRDARLAGSYTDRTGNLRSSIGFVIVDNGKIEILAGFKQVKDGVIGQKNGQNYAKSLAANYNTGIVLIVVAGMNYAAYVQRRGYNVTASAELIAEQLLAQLNNKLNINAKIEHV